jgi:hypothetical protein
MIRTRIIASSLLVLSSLTACGGESSPTGKANVIKSMGSLQCSGGGLSLAALQGQLVAANVQVTSAACGTDGLPKAAICGESDGKIGIFEIPSEKVSAASAAGFTLLSTLPAAKPIACLSAAQ